MEKLVYQMFILGTGGVNNLQYLQQALKKGVGGIIYFTRDIENKEQFCRLIKEHSSIAIVPPFLSIDQEGGRVERTENIHERYLSPKFAFDKGLDFLENQTEKIALELKEYGINLNFAPCADVNTNPNNPIIGERAFADNPQDVIKGVKITSETYRRNGIIPCVKHYPGHGDADKDSHLTLPVINLSFEEMNKKHIYPFEFAVKDGIEMIMAAHLHCTCFDKETTPASLSQNAIGYLRNKLNYNGIIISDDMVMKGVQDYGAIDAIIMGIKAGLDMFIYRDADKNTIDTINELVKIILQDKELTECVLKSNERINHLKKKYNII